ncbi:hypothetical protein Tco_1440528 [Tanacetum coccineum]
MSKHKGIYVAPSHTKKIFANMKREGKGFSGRITHLFQIMMVQAPKDMCEDSAAPTNSHSTPIVPQLSSSKPQKKKSRRKQRKESGPTEPIPDKDTNEEPISTPSCDPPQSGVDRFQLAELMTLFGKEKEVKNFRAQEVRKVGSASRVESSNDVSLGAQEDASKQEKKTTDLNADAEVTLIDETQERYDEGMLFDVQDDLQGEEVVAEKEVAKNEVSAADPITNAGEVVTTASATTTVDELTLAQTLIEIKAAKPKAVTTAATKITTAVASTRLKAKGIVFHDQEEQASAFTPIHALTDKQYRQEDIQELMSKLLEDVRNISEELSEYINCPSWNRPTIFYDNDDDEYTIIYSKPKAITPDLPIEEPDNSLSMGDEHLSTISETESDELIKSSVENLVPIPSEFNGISDDTCDVPVCENPSTFDALNDHSKILSDSNDDGTSSDDNDFEDIEYVSLEQVNDVDQEEKEFDLEDILQIQDIILREKLLNINR